MRAAILEAARALYRDGGFAGVTMRAIAHQLGIRAPSLYHHFVSKEAIFVALQEQALVLLKERLHMDVADPMASVRQFFWGYYEFSKSHPDHFALTWVDRSTPPFQGMFTSPIVGELAQLGHQRIRAAMDAGRFPPNLDLQKASVILWSAMLGVSVLRMINNGAMGDEQARDTLETTIEGLMRTGSAQTDTGNP